MFKEKTVKVLDTSVLTAGSLITIEEISCDSIDEDWGLGEIYNGIITGSTEDSLSFMNIYGNTQCIPINRICDGELDTSYSTLYKILGVAKSVVGIAGVNQNG